MGFIDWIKEKLGLFDDDEDFFYELGLNEADDAMSVSEALKKQPLIRRDLNVHNRLERERYVRSICEQMMGGSDDVDLKKSEYQKITDKLQDIDEIEALPVNDRNEIRRCARAILDLEDQEAKYKRPQLKISERQYREMESMENELPKILKTLEENERYQATVRRDMNLLEGEKAALAYQRKDDRESIANAKAYFVVALFAAGLSYLVVFALYATARMDFRMPVSVVSALLAIALTVIFLRFRDARASLEKTNRQINRAISLQNTAKVKYVNVTNLIDYEYLKYGINSSHELYYRFEKYMEEREARYHTENTAMKFELLRNELNGCLRRFRIKEPAVWVYQPILLIDDAEMTALRHDLVIQRQKLRKGIDFEIFNLENAKKDLSDLVMQYPQYSKEIMAIVDQYE